MKRFSYITILFFVNLLIIGCNSYECSDNKNSLPLAGFYSSQPIPESISIDSISVWGIDSPNNSLLLDNESNIHSLYMPFKIDISQTSFVFHYNQKALRDDRYNDTIEFNYNITPYFVSAACGVIYKYELTQINHTKHVIDSVVCPYDIIDNKAIENIRIYFRTSSAEI